MNEIGHNLPPDMTLTAGDTMRDISAFMAENPIIDNEAYAREAKVFIDRGKLCLQDLEAEREAKVKPLNQQVQTINDHYRSPRTLLQKVLDELKNRVSAYVSAEEKKKQLAADAARMAAIEAERIARDAELVERERIANAEAGELDINIAEAIEQADKAFSAYQKAERQAAIAEKETKVKVGGGWGRAIGLRTKETLIVDDAISAINEIGVTDAIKEAIITSARAYRKLRGKLPAGISVETERKV